MVHVENSKCSLMQNRLCYGSTWLEIGIPVQLLMKISRIEFNQCCEIMNGAVSLWP
jgi:hypothetical protein